MFPYMRFHYSFMYFLINLLHSTYTIAPITSQIGVFCTKHHLQYGYGCRSSNFNFLKDRGRTGPFSTVYINTIATCYKFKNGLDLAISDATLKQMIKRGKIAFR